MFNNRIHVSDPDGNESTIRYEHFRAVVRFAATPQPTGDGGVKVTEGVTILSFDDDQRLTFVIEGTSYTILERR